MNGISLSELVRKSVLEKIEAEYDLRAYNKAMAEFKKNPTTYTLDEIEEELGLK
ncbi:MAG: CopG family transcriptional regulator [Erysipelotrichia bacterium]|nr:CopG family transcriptional regulator [Erysipelotrichia bacterium]